MIFFNSTKRLSLTCKTGTIVLTSTAHIRHSWTQPQSTKMILTTTTESSHRFSSSKTFQKTFNYSPQVLDIISRRFLSPRKKSSMGSYLWALLHDISSSAATDREDVWHPASPACLLMDSVSQPHPSFDYWLPKAFGNFSPERCHTIISSKSAFFSSAC